MVAQERKEMLKRVEGGIRVIRRERGDMQTCGGKQDRQEWHNGINVSLNEICVH